MEEERNEVYTDEEGRRVVPASALKIVATHKHIVLADGTDIESGSCVLNHDDNTLWLWIGPGVISMSEAFAIFNDPQKTSRIESWIFDDEEPKVYMNYTELANIQTDYEQKLSINLRHHQPEE